MPIVVTCPSCSTRLKVADQSAGKMVKCPKCAAAIPVPATGGEQLAETPSAAPPAAADAASAGDASAAPKKSNKKLFIALRIGAVLLLSCCCLGTVGGIASYFLFSNSSKSKVTKANYDALHDGMTLADIEKILGSGQPTTPEDVQLAYKNDPFLVPHVKKTEPDKVRDGHKAAIAKDADYCWKNGDDMIIVVFSGGSAKDTGKAAAIIYSSSSSDPTIFLSKGTLPPAK
jgi:predicted Zn finger-like uncharacterized protein